MSIQRTDSTEAILAHLISIAELEAKINQIRVIAPPINGVLSTELRIMAEIYGNMIYTKAQSVDLHQLAINTQPAVFKLLENLFNLQLNNGESSSRPYGPNSDSCEACQ